MYCFQILQHYQHHKDDFVGWQYSASVGEAGGWIRKTEPDIVAYDNDYLKAVRDGDLVAADFETAQLCGVAFFADIKKVD